MNLNAGKAARVRNSGLYNFSAAGAASLSFAIETGGKIVTSDAGGFTITPSGGSPAVITAAATGAGALPDLLSLIKAEVEKQDGYKAEIVRGDRLHIFHESGGKPATLSALTKAGGVDGEIVNATVGRANNPAIVRFQGAFALSDAVVPKDNSVGISVDLPMCWVKSDADASLNYVRKGD